MTACFRCGADVDPLRSPARIVEARIVSICRGCATAPPIPVARPTLPIAAEIVARPQRPARRVLVVAVGVAAVALAAAPFAALRSGEARPSSSPPVPAAAIEVLPPPPPPALDLPPPPPAPAPVKPAPRALPTGTFVHPLPGPRRHDAEAEDRRFGSARPGIRAPSCGAGHCGVDIGDVEGTPVLAARGGVVERVVRQPDERGGRWVMVRHAGGMSTYYMHLGQIRADLVPGVRVDAGEALGTLGHSGILRSSPHLHFAITVSGDTGGESYVDPSPYLARARLMDPPAAAEPEPEPAAFLPEPSTIGAAPSMKMIHGLDKKD